MADSPQFDEWQFFQTERLRQAFASHLEKLVGILRDQGDYNAAITYAQRWLKLDPLHEPAHRSLMHLYARTDQQAAALRQYETCRQLLAIELDVTPAPETTVLYSIYSRASSLPKRPGLDPLLLPLRRAITYRPRPQPLLVGNKNP